MNANHPKAPAPAAPFHKVAQNLYRLVSSGTYYALFKRSGKQIRKSLKDQGPRTGVAAAEAAGEA